MKNKSLIIVIVLIVFVVILSVFLFRKTEINFTINKDKLVLKEGNTEKIDYSINNAEITITWTSSNPNVATVNNGIVTAKQIGTTVITGTINDGENTKTITCLVTVRAENYDIVLEDITLPEGEILLSTSSTYPVPITYVPNNGYVTSIEYFVENNDIIKVENDVITALSPGNTMLDVTVNNSINKQIKVNVTNNQVKNNIIKPANEISLNEENLLLYTGDTKEITYDINPTDGEIFDTNWKSNNTNIASVDENGIVKGLNIGTTTIEAVFNNTIRKTINVTIKSKITDIKLDYSPKEVIKVGESFTLHPTILPANTPNITIQYESNNPDVLSVNQNGTCNALKSGSAIITIKSEGSDVTKTVSFTVVDATGVINTDKIIWGFSKSTDTVPKKATTDFFMNLVKSGKGTLSNNVYTYQKYSYNISSNLLTIDNNRKIYMRVYYPENKDLSTLNTFTFIGGVGEENFGGYFKNIESNPELLKNSGITILIPESSRAKVQAANVVDATEFVKKIINQNQYARNAVGGYSNGGPPAGEAAWKGKYNKIVLINTSFYWVNSKTNIKDIEVVFYVANGDSWKGTGSFVNELYQNGFKNVIVITNNGSYVNSFKDKYLVINPGNSMKQGHTSANITLSHFFSFAID